MSHVSAMKVEIKDVECLARACDRMGWEFKMNSRQFKSYAGFTNCDHEIVVPGASYTVGVKAAYDGSGHLRLEWDSYYAGGLSEKLGPEGTKVQQAYAIQKAMDVAASKGMRCDVEELPDGRGTMMVTAYSVSNPGAKVCTTVDAGGGAEVAGFSFKGNACDVEMAALKEAIGVEERRDNKPEYYGGGDGQLNPGMN